MFKDGLSVEQLERPMNIHEYQGKAMFKRYGVRGRLWAYWFVQTLEGSICIILSLVTLGLDAPVGPWGCDPDAVRTFDCISFSDYERGNAQEGY
mgnify:CR=1 FL=1